MEKILAELEKIPNRILLDASKLALKAGNKKAANMVVLGAAVPFLNIEEEAVLEGMHTFFAPKGERVVSVNMEAYNYGKEFAMEIMQKK
jgi:indolepyruvate ferredoxin oxidoreductase beta subunit